MNDQPFRILIRPAKRLFSRRQQWTFEIRGANGEPIDPRDTYANRVDIVYVWRKLLAGPVEFVMYDRYGNVESRERYDGE